MTPPRRHASKKERKNCEALAVRSVDVDVRAM
jgi:hypothetical protein